MRHPIATTVIVLAALAAMSIRHYPDWFAATVIIGACFLAGARAGMRK